MIGNLNEEGYLIATEDELLGLAEDEMTGPARPEPSHGGPRLRRRQQIRARLARLSEWRGVASAEDSVVAAEKSFRRGGRIEATEPEVNAEAAAARPTVPRPTPGAAAYCSGERAVQS